jgi:alkylated DNA repair dioxygenase AlkB
MSAEECVIEIACDGSLYCLPPRLRSATAPSQGGRAGMTPARLPGMMDQLGFFEIEPRMPAGFVYQRDLLTRAEETALVDQIGELQFKEFEFHGFVGKRRVVSFGWRYDFSERRVERSREIPSFLLPVRAAAARFAGLDPDALQHVLVTEYGVGAAIGWHKDKAVFDHVIGVSLLSSCEFRLRRAAGDDWERATITVEPRSGYLLTGPARTEWEHSIPGVKSLRYSITFRDFLGEPPTED